MTPTGPRRVRRLVDPLSPARREVRRLLRIGHGLGPAVLTVSGESWSGRAAVLDHAAGAAQELGFRVLRVGLVPLDADVPFGAAAAVLRPLVADGPLVGRPVLTHRLDALDHLFCGPTRPPPAPPVDRAAEQLRLFEDARRLLRRACAGRPVLLVLDDLGRADPSSIDLLRYVVVQSAGLPLRVIASLAPAAAAQDGLAVDDGAPPAPVAAADPFADLRPIAGRPVPVRRRLELRRSRGRRSPRDLPADQLAPGEDAVLALLGAAGGVLDRAVLETVESVTLVGPALAGLQARGLVRLGLDRRQPVVRSRNWWAAATAYQRLGAEERQLKHRQLLRASLAQAPAETAVPAYQAVRAGSSITPGERLAVLTAHALTARACCAEATTLRIVDTALAACEAADAVSLRAELLDIRADALVAVGRPVEAVTSWREAAARAGEERSVTAAHRHRRLAEIEWALGRPAEALADVQRAAAALPARPVAEHVAVESLRAWIRTQLALGRAPISPAESDDVLAPLAELWRRTGWKRAEEEYKLALNALRIAAAPRAPSSSTGPSPRASRTFPPTA